MITVCDWPEMSEVLSDLFISHSYHYFHAPSPFSLSILVTCQATVRQRCCAAIHEALLNTERRGERNSRKILRRKNDSKNSPNVCSDAQEKRRGEIFRETPLPAREEETGARSRDADMSITFSFSFPAQPEFSPVRLSATFKPASKSNHFALTEIYPLKLDVTGDSASDRLIYDAKSRALDNDSKSLAHSAISSKISSTNWKLSLITSRAPRSNPTRTSREQNSYEFSETSGSKTRLSH